MYGRVYSQQAIEACCLLLDAVLIHLIKCRLWCASRWHNHSSLEMKLIHKSTISPLMMSYPLSRQGNQESYGPFVRRINSSEANFCQRVDLGRFQQILQIKIVMCYSFVGTCAFGLKMVSTIRYFYVIDWQQYLKCRQCDELRLCCKRFLQCLARVGNNWIC